MNDLNSVLLEGKIHVSPVLGLLNKTKRSCTLVVASSLLYKIGDTPNEELTMVRVETTGSLAERCAGLTIGRKVRVIGRIKFDTEIYIEAEHVEFKPA